MALPKSRTALTAEAIGRRVSNHLARMQKDGIGGCQFDQEYLNQRKANNIKLMPLSSLEEGGSLPLKNSPSVRGYFGPTEEGGAGEPAT